MKGIRSVSRFMACGCPVVPTSFLEKAIVFLHSIAFASCQRSVDDINVGLSLGSFFCSADLFVASFTNPTMS